jgi:hypothetical protein
LQRGVLPRAVHGTPSLLRDFQHSLCEKGVPLVWLLDVGVSDPAFAQVQMQAISGELPLSGHDLRLR